MTEIRTPSYGRISIETDDAHENRLSFKWSIDGFFANMSRAWLLSMKSPTFVSRNQSKWRLSVSTGWINQMHRGEYRVNLFLLESLVSPIEALVKVSILTNGGDNYETRDFYMIFKAGNYCDYYEFKLDRTNEREVINDGTLTFSFEISSLSNQHPCLPKRGLRLHDSLKHLLESSKFTDVTLVCEGNCELQAHKVLLAARSNYFAAIFERWHTEGEERRVDLTDVGFEVMKEVLHFFYTDQVPKLEKMAFELLRVADKYEVLSLVDVCERYLGRSITLDNVARILIFVDEHHSDELKKTAQRFVTGHYNDVSRTQSWKNMIKTHPHLLALAPGKK